MVIKVQLELHNIPSFVIKTCFPSAPDAFWVAAAHWSPAGREWYAVVILHLTPKKRSDLPLTLGLNNQMHKQRSSTKDVNRRCLTAWPATEREGNKLIFDWLFSASMYCNINVVRRPQGQFFLPESTWSFHVLLWKYKILHPYVYTRSFNFSILILKHELSARLKCSFDHKTRKTFGECSSPPSR